MTADTCPYVYPTTDDVVAASKTILSSFGGQPVDHNCLIHCGYTVLGFALSQIFADDHPLAPAGGMSAADCSPEECEVKLKTTLQAVVAAHETTGGKKKMEAAVGAIDWSKILGFIMTLVQQWLMKSPTPTPAA